MSLSKKDTILITFIRSFSGFSFYLFIPFLAVWLEKQRDYDAGTIAWLVGGTVLISRAGSILLPLVLPRSNLRTTLLSCYGIIAVAFFAMTPVGAPFALDVFALVAASFGFCAATLKIKSFISESCAVDERIRMFSLLNIAINASAAIGPACAGFILAKNPELLTIFAGSAQIAGIFAVCFINKQAGDVSVSASPKSVLSAGWMRHISAKFLIFSAISAVSFFGYAQFFIVFPAAAAATIGPKEAALYFSVNGILIILLQYPMAQLMRRLTQKSSAKFNRLLVAGNLILSLSLVLFSIAIHTSGIVLMLAVILFTVSELIWGPLYDTLIEEVRGQVNAMVAFGMIGIFWGLAESGGASAGLYLMEKSKTMGVMNPFAVSAALVFLAAISFWFLPVIRSHPSIVENKGVQI